MDEPTLLPSFEILCPYCGERISVMAESTVGDQRFIEDCTVCCKPIEFELTIDRDGDPVVVARRESD